MNEQEGKNWNTYIAVLTQPSEPETEEESEGYQMWFALLCHSCPLFNHSIELEDAVARSLACNSLLFCLAHHSWQQPAASQVTINTPFFCQNSHLLKKIREQKELPSCHAVISSPWFYHLPIPITSGLMKMLWMMLFMLSSPRKPVGWLFWIASNWLHSSSHSYKARCFFIDWSKSYLNQC